ncbi:hypothetical protein DL768_005145 [Monosporascus sp. mg162]|nr:hypothetical protein DL768_005145 [Monosporascus sp. mg162]
MDRAPLWSVSNSYSGSSHKLKVHNMTPQPTSGLPSGITDYLIKILEISQRLEGRVSSYLPSSAPLTRLAQSVVRELLAEIPVYHQKVCNLQPRITTSLNYDESAGSASEIHTIFQRIHTLIIQSLHILNFVIEKAGQNDEDQEIDVLYASLYILNDCPLGGSVTAHRRVKMIRMAHEFITILASAGIGPRAEPCLSPEAMRDRVSRCRLQFTSFFDRLAPQLSSRYIHTYAKDEDVPYAEDFSARPFLGSCAVFKVREKSTGENFAMKRFENILPCQRKQISRELGILELCTHRNLIQLVEAFEVGCTTGSISLVIAPWAPVTLTKFLTWDNDSRKMMCPWFRPNEASTDKCIFRLMREITDGIQYLHSFSIKHKDIKPDNILLYNESTIDLIPIVADVGISKVYSAGAPTKYTNSTYPYLSPEQQAHRESSLKSDIWQLGCCFSMLLVVSRGGTSAVDELWESFTDHPRSCNIADEFGSFNEALGRIYSGGTEAQQHAYGVVRSMLDLDPSSRCDAAWVQGQLGRLC